MLTTVCREHTQKGYPKVKLAKMSHKHFEFGHPLTRSQVYAFGERGTKENSDGRYVKCPFAALATTLKY